MTDREMLLLAYGSLKGRIGTDEDIIKTIEAHLWGKKEQPNGPKASKSVSKELEKGEGR